MRYDYRCLNCGTVVEESGGFDDDTKVLLCHSQKCNGSQQNFYRIISGKPPAVILKGNCWASDGYSSQENKKK